MKIQSAPAIARNPLPTKAQQPEEPEGKASRAGGAIGAAVGATAGRALLPLGTAALAGDLVSHQFGAVAGWATRVVVLAATGAAEYQWKVGRLAGGMIGGALGFGLGSAAGALGVKPHGQLAEVTQEFSLKNLPRVLRDTENTSQKLACFKPEAEEAFKGLRPGDILAVQSESQFGMAARLQKLVGASGDYTHTGMVTQEGQVIEIIGGAGVRLSDPNQWLYNEHVAVLRPQFAGPESLKKTLAHLVSYLPSQDWTKPNPKSLSYDERLSLKSDDEQYCTEFLYKAAKDNAPELELKPSSTLGFKYVTVDDFKNNPHVDTVFSTGSNFWTNQVSRFV